MVHGRQGNKRAQEKIFDETNRKKSWVSRVLRAGRDKGSEVSRLVCKVIFRLSDISSDTEHQHIQRWEQEHAHHGHTRDSWSYNILCA